MWDREKYKKNINDFLKKNFMKLNGIHPIYFKIESLLKITFNIVCRF